MRYEDFINAQIKRNDEDANQMNEFALRVRPTYETNLLMKNLLIMSGIIADHLAEIDKKLESIENGKVQN